MRTRPTWNAAALVAALSSVAVVTGCGEPEPARAPAFRPLVPDLEPPPKSVLTAQKALAALSAGCVRSEDGRISCRRDGAEMVLVPETEFTMGSDDGGYDEAPPHRVRLSAFLVDRHEVTNAQFEKFVAETGFRTEAEKAGKARVLIGDDWPETKGADWRHPRGPGSSVEGRGRDPVVLVSWNDAKAFADWAGRRLLTEAEFERCLRGGSEGQDYAWGMEESPPARSGNFGDQALRRANPSAKWADKMIEGYDDGFAWMAPVGSFPPNALGLFDVSGNVWEWCADWWEAEYYANSPARDPQGPPAGEGFRVRRGGGWASGLDPHRCSYRDGNAPEYLLDSVGFRCGKSLP